MLFSVTPLFFADYFYQRNARVSHEHALSALANSSAYRLAAELRSPRTDMAPAIAEICQHSAAQRIIIIDLAPPVIPCLDLPEAPQILQMGRQKASLFRNVLFETQIRGSTFIVAYSRIEGNPAAVAVLKPEKDSAVAEIHLWLAIIWLLVVPIPSLSVAWFAWRAAKTSPNSM